MRLWTLAAFIAVPAAAGAQLESLAEPPVIAAGLWRITPGRGAPGPVRDVCGQEPTAPDIALSAWPHPNACPAGDWRLYREAFWMGAATCSAPGGKAYSVAVDVEGDLARAFELRINLAPLPLKRSGSDDSMDWYEAERLGDCPQSGASAPPA